MKNQRYVGVIVKHNNKVLLCKRNHKGSHPGMWSIPCGKLESGETAQEGAKREFFEETAVDIDNMELEFAGLIPRISRDGTKIKGFMYVYLLETDTIIEPDLDAAIDGDEHSEWGYFTANQIKPETSGTHMAKLAKIVLQKRK